MEPDDERLVLEQPLLFELRMPVDDGSEEDKMLVLERTPDENAARLAFDAVRKALSNLKPRVRASVELYLGTTVLDVFEQTEQI